MDWRETVRRSSPFKISWGARESGRSRWMRRRPRHRNANLAAGRRTSESDDRRCSWPAIPLSRTQVANSLPTGGLSSLPRPNRSPDLGNRSRCRRAVTNYRFRPGRTREQSEPRSPRPACRFQAKCLKTPVHPRVFHPMKIFFGGIATEIIPSRPFPPASMPTRVVFSFMRANTARGRICSRRRCGR